LKITPQSEILTRNQTTLSGKKRYPPCEYPNFKWDAPVPCTCPPLLSPLLKTYLISYNIVTKKGISSILTVCIHILLLDEILKAWNIDGNEQPACSLLAG